LPLTGFSISHGPFLIVFPRETELRTDKIITHDHLPCVIRGAI
jgi:hypothetical protein